MLKKERGDEKKPIPKKEKKKLEKKAINHLWMHAKSWEDMTKSDGIKIFTEAD